METEKNNIEKELQWMGRVDFLIETESEIGEHEQRIKFCEEMLEAISKDYDVSHCELVAYKFFKQRRMIREVEGEIFKSYTG